MLTWESRPSLRRPVLVVAFEGWSDAGGAASTALRYLGSSWSARQFGAFDPEELYDFTVARPRVRLVDGLNREVDWPGPELHAAPARGADRDVILLVGLEPHLRWRTFCSTVVGVAQELGTEFALSLGALQAEVPHTTSVSVTGTTTNQGLLEKWDLTRSQYEGPTGVLGALHDALGKAGIPSASLWATVPHYVSQTPSPKAALALVRAATNLLGASVSTVDLEIASAAYERQVNEVVAADEDMADYVRRLEQAAAEATETDLRLPDSETLAAEAERFLRDQGS